jgi:lipid-binding SYLF domain-containing protein
MKHWISILVLLVLIGMCVLAESQVGPLGDNPDISPINVVVVGVTDYTSSDYKPDPTIQRSETVGGKIEQRCNDINSFFKRTYGKSAKVKLLCTPAETTKPALEKYFTREFKKNAEDTLSVVFLMSHGEQVESNGSVITPDLRIVTSDTTHEDPDLTSLGFTKDVMNWLEGPPIGATIYLFVDTCHSGAFKNVQVTRRGDLDNEKGLYLNVMASSLPSDKSFAASFTKAILDIWESKELCLNDAGLPNRIHNLIQGDSPIILGDFEGRPIPVFRYQGSGCLFSRAKDDRLLLLYGGANLPDTVYRVVSTPANQKVSDGDMIMKSYEYVRLPEGEYDVEIKERETNSFTTHINLTGPTNLTEILYLQKNLTGVHKARANSLAADAAQRLGHSTYEITSLRHRAADLYNVNGEFEKADEELAKLEVPPDNFWATPTLPTDAKTAVLAGRVLEKLAGTRVALKATIPSEILESSKCIVVIPSFSAGGIFTGNRQGQGVATCRDSAIGWTNPIAVKLKGGGSPFGAFKKPSDTVLLIMNDSGKQLLFSQDFKIGVEATTEAGPVMEGSSNQGIWAGASDILGYSIDGANAHGQNFMGTTLKLGMNEEVLYPNALSKPLQDLTTTLNNKNPN